MKKIEAIKRAIVKALDLPTDEVICIYRTSPRCFEFEIGIEPGKKNLVQMIHVKWVKNGWYEKYHPEWCK